MCSLADPELLVRAHAGFSDPSYDTDVSGCTIQGDTAAAQQHGGSRGGATVAAGTVTEHHAQVTVSDGFITFDGEWQSNDGLHCQSVSYMVVESGTRSRYRHTHATGVVSSTQMVGDAVWFEIGTAMTTYASGAQHCASNDLVVCCYEDYCPQGAANPPLGGTRNGDEWAPTRDRENSWVQVGLWGGDPANTCVLHQDLSGGIYGLPGWGATGDSARHQGWVLCCRPTGDNSCAAVGGSSGSELRPSDMAVVRPPPAPPAVLGRPRRLPRDGIKINFQPPDMPVPMGYLKDSGALFGDRGNGYVYGWSCDLEALGDYRDRNDAHTRESSLIIPDRSQNCATETWNIEVPNGDYR